MLRSLNQFIKVQRFVVGCKRLYPEKLSCMHFHFIVFISSGSRRGETHPSGMHIPDETYISLAPAILANDMRRAIKAQYVRVLGRLFLANLRLLSLKARCARSRLCKLTALLDGLPTTSKVSKRNLVLPFRQFVV